MKTMILLPVVCSVLGFCFIGCTGVMPTNLGVKDGKLAPCPDTPNCVSSQSTDREHGIEPLPFTKTPAEAMAALERTILAMKRTRIVARTDQYLHVEFTSFLWRFVDDVEFFVDARARVIHLRSASRLGKSDLGVNRERVEAIRAAWKGIDI